VAEVVQGMQSHGASMIAAARSAISRQDLTLLSSPTFAAFNCLRGLALYFLKIQRLRPKYYTVVRWISCASD